MVELSQHPVVPRRLGPHDVESPPWDIGRPQPAILALAEAGALAGRVLDIGCGTGEHVLLAAQLGRDATGVDTSSAALAVAERKARQRGLTARFLQQDACLLHDLGERFDTVLDCGLFHALSQSSRTSLVAGLRCVVPPGGRYLMLGGWGPHPIDPSDITAAFIEGWRIDAIERAVVEVNLQPGRLAALLVQVTRT